MIKNSVGIFGPPGTGKTKELVSRIEEAAATGKRIAVFSHSRAAAKELTSRIKSKLAFVGTIHSFCFHYLDLAKSAVVERKDFIAFLGEIYEEQVNLALDLIENSRTSGRSYSEIYHNLSARKFISWDYLEFVQQSYYNWKKNNGLYDFSDMIHWTIKDIQRNGVKANLFDYIFIDEAQDLSRSQWELIHLLTTPSTLLIAAGDDDQAVYQWAGAWPQGMEVNCEKHIILTQSYRLPESIWEKAVSISNRIKNRKKKEFLSAKHIGGVSYYLNLRPDFLLHLHLDSNGKVLILCRDKWNLKEVEEMLIAMGIPYLIEGGISGPGLFMNKKAQVARLLDSGDFEPKKVMNWLTPSAQNAWNSINIMPVWWQSVRMTGEQVNYLFKAGLHSECKITLSTIHSQKGREADCVVVISKVTNQTAYSEFDSVESMDTELRVWYVAVTRSKSYLYIIGSNNFIN